MGDGSIRNQPCRCGSGIKQKKCCKGNGFVSEIKSMSDDMNPEDIKEVLGFFNDIERDNQVLKHAGIHRGYQQIISRIKEGYLISLDKGIFKILSDEILSFYEIIGVIAMETLGSEWIKEQKEKEVKNRSEIYKIITILGATGEFKKVILYEGKRIESYVPENGFSKNFLTFAFDIFCLRHQGELPQSLIERLKQFDQYQGARYELAVAAIFCRLGYDIEWLDDKSAKEKHPEFIARKNGEEIYVEAKSRHIKGVHNTLGVFDEIKAFKSTGWGSLIFQALKKQVPSAKQFIVFIDMNAINDGNLPPKWLEDIRKTLAKQHLKEYLGKEAPFTSVIFTNYSYHYQGGRPAEKGISFVYENDLTSRPYSSTQEKIEILDAIKHYGFIPDYHIPAPMTILQRSSEFPRINNINQILS